MYFRSSNGSRGTRWSAKTDQSSCQRLNMIAGRVGGSVPLSSVASCAAACADHKQSAAKAALSRHVIRHLRRNDVTHAYRVHSPHGSRRCNRQGIRRFDLPIMLEANDIVETNSSPPKIGSRVADQHLLQMTPCPDKVAQIILDRTEHA